MSAPLLLILLWVWFASKPQAPISVAFQNVAICHPKRKRTMSIGFDPKVSGSGVQLWFDDVWPVIPSTNYFALPICRTEKSANHSMHFLILPLGLRLHPGEYFHQRKLLGFPRHKRSAFGNPKPRAQRGGG